jgi:hypothetical protein
LTARARLAATLLSRLAGLEFWLLGAPWGGRRERWHRPQRTQAARGLRLECEDGDGAGWAGGITLEWAPPAASASRPRLKREGGAHLTRSASLQSPLEGDGG